MCLSRNRDVAVLGIWWLLVVTESDMFGEGQALGTEHIPATGHVQSGRNPRILRWAALQKQQDHLKKGREGLRPLTAQPDSGRSCLQLQSPKPHTARFSLLQNSHTWPPRVLQESRMRAGPREPQCSPWSNPGVPRGRLRLLLRRSPTPPHPRPAFVRENSVALEVLPQPFP